MFRGFRECTILEKVNTTLYNLVNYNVLLTLSAMAPWDLIDSRGGVFKVPRPLKTLKTSLNHDLTMIFATKFGGFSNKQEMFLLRGKNGFHVLYVIKNWYSPIIRFLTPPPILS